MKRWVFYFVFCFGSVALAAVTTTVDTLKFRGSTSGLITMQATATAGTNTLTLPARTATVATSTGATTTNNCAKFDSSGNVVDAGAACSGGGGSPGGSNGQVQYNNSGSFGGIATTGSGSVVLATSPTLTTPALGTPSAVVLTNATGLPAAQVPATPLSTGTSVSLTAPRQYYVCTSTCTVTPPVPAAGYEFCVLNGDNVSTVITLAALGSSARYENQARTAYGTAGTGTLVSGGAVKDQVCIIGLDSTHYLTTTATGTWTAN